MFNERLRELVRKGMSENELIGRQIKFYNSLTSTQTKAKELTLEGDFEGLVVIAAEQTEGVGRLSRSWVSPEGNVYMSILLKPEMKDLPYLIMFASVAVARGVEALTGIKVSLKWPNDVFIGKRKVSGILIETEIKGDEVDFTSIGVGIDVRLDVSKYPELEGIATSMQEEAEKEINIEDVVGKVLKEMDALYVVMKKTPIAVYDEWKKLMGILGEEVSVTCGDDIYVGIAEDVLQDGSLMLKIKDSGEMKKIVCGDVTRCRI